MVGWTAASTSLALLDRNRHEYLMLSCVGEYGRLHRLLQLLIRGDMREVSIGIAHYLVFNLDVVKQSLLLLFGAISHLTASHRIQWHVLGHIDLLLG